MLSLDLSLPPSASLSREGHHNPIITQVASTLNDRSLDAQSQESLLDTLMWKAHFEGIWNLLQGDTNQGKLQRGESVNIPYTVCPYGNSPEPVGDSFYNIFYTKIQAWAIEKSLSYSQKIIENGVVEMMFTKINIPHES